MNGAWRSAALAAAIVEVETSLDAAWQELLSGRGICAGTPAEAALARAVVEDPAGYEWRTVDAAIARLSCPACGAPVTTGPLTCGHCEFVHGMRFGAREIDRPGVPPGNEHAIRVASAVARTRGRYSPRARVGYELVLPALIAGSLPTSRQAQAMKAFINKLTPDECDRVTSAAEVERIARTRR